MIGEVDFGSEIMGDVGDDDRAILDRVDRALGDFSKPITAISTAVTTSETGLLKCKFCLNAHRSYL